MIDRDLLNALNDQLFQRDSRPVVLCGPPLCGKSTLAAMFAKRFANSLSFDISKPAEHKLFIHLHERTAFFQELYLSKNKLPGTGRTLLLLEGINENWHLPGEIAGHPQRPADLFILATATTPPPAFLSQQKVRILYMHPLSFREFLSHTAGPEMLSLYLESPSPDHAYEPLLKLFHEYTLTGGMPGIVEKWTSGAGTAELTDEYDEILSAWLKEVRSNSPGKKSGLTAGLVLQEAAAYAATRITYHRFANLPYGSREVSGAFRILESNLVVRRHYPATSTTDDTSCDENRAPRLQFFDTGVVNHISGIRHRITASADLNTLFRGQVLRHVTGQELSSAGDEGSSRLRFWVRPKNQSTAEVDFIIPFGGMIIPVVLSNSEPGRLRSLHQFIDSAPHPYAVRLWGDRLRIKQTSTVSGKQYYLLSLPYYLASRIPEHIEGLVKMVG